MKNRRSLATRPPERGAALVWILLAVLALAVGGVMLWNHRSTAPEKDVTLTAVVTKEKMRISVVESGQLKAAKSNDIYCEVRGTATILKLIDEGKEVHKGDELVRLDASNLEDELTAQKIKFEQANAAFIQAEKTRDIQVSLNQSNVDKAQLDQDLAKTDLTKYEEGDYELKKAQSNSDILLASADEANAKMKEKDTQQLVELDFAAQSELDSNKLDSQRAEVKRQMAEKQSAMLEKFEKPRQMQVLIAAVKQTEAELERVKMRCDADLAQKEADFRSKKATFDLEKSKLDQLTDQLAKTVIVAPTDGLVVYPMNQSGGMGRGGGDRDRIEEGATVREHQLLISLPDTSEMLVGVSVHESAIDKVKVGQPVIVTIDAIAEQSFVGKVTFIAPLPDSQNQWLNPDLKVYRCEIAVGGETRQLRPGMSASAEIVIDDLDETIAVPLHAVHRRGDNYFVYVDSAEHKAKIREVKIGPHNDQRVAISDGLNVGEKVFLAVPTDAEQPNFPEAKKSAQTSVDELRQKASAITPKNGRDDAKTAGGDGRGPGFRGGFDPAAMEKWKNMTPEERKKAWQEQLDKMSPEERKKWEEASKRAQPQGGGDGAKKEGGSH